MSGRDDRVRWRQVESFGVRYLADFALGRLRDAGIPARLRGTEEGIWGPGFAGPTSRGLTLLVPEDRWREARRLLADAPEDDGDPSAAPE